MTKIQRARGCTVIVTVDADPEVLDTLVEHARTGLERFQDFAGFLGGALHVSEDRSRMVQVVDWTSEEAYVACRDAPLWDDLPSARHFLDTVASGRARLDARVYEVVGTSGLTREGGRP